MPDDVTLIRMAAPHAGAATYVAVPAAKALDVMAHAGAFFADVGDFDVNTMPWETLPGIQQMATDVTAVAVQLGEVPVVFIGTVVDGQWTSWYPPCPQPPVPAAG